MRQELSDAITEYQLWRSSMDYSKQTLANERSVLKRFLSITGNIWCHSIEPRHLTNYFTRISATRKPHTQRLDHTVLNQFFEWCRHTRRMPLDRDPMHGRRKPKKPTLERQRIPVGKFPLLLNEAGTQDPRDRALVALYLYTLARDREVASLRVRDWDRDEGWLRMVIFKSNKEDLMPVSSELDRELRQWMTVYQGGPNDYLIPRRYSVATSRSAGGQILAHEFAYDHTLPIGPANKTITPILKRVGFVDEDKSGEGAHTLRRSGARALFDQLSAQGYDYSLRIVQSMLHHSSVSVTETYIGLSADRKNRDDLIRLRPMYGDFAEVVSISDRLGVVNK